MRVKIDQVNHTIQKTIIMHWDVGRHNLISIQECINSESRNLTAYLVNIKQDPLRYATNAERFTNNGFESANEF